MQHDSLRVKRICGQAFWLLILLLPYTVAHSQVGTVLPYPTTSFRIGTPLDPTLTKTGSAQPPAYSPSVTSFLHGSSEYVVSAYVYRNGPHTRTVGFSRSTDGGATWNEITSGGTPVSLTTPGVTGQTLDNQDEPQILSVGGDTLVCVIRAWAGGSSLGLGGAYQEQFHAIHRFSAILIYKSFDAGSTWGYYDGSSSGILDVSDGSSNTTLENPRITFRPAFSNKGYIVWQKKSWSFTTADSFRVSDSWVGMSAFMVGTYSSTTPTPGKLYTASYNVTYTKFGLSGTYKGPERPSVATAPDGSVWVAYYSPDYGSATLTPDIWNGYQEPLAVWQMASATCDVSSGHAVFSTTSGVTFLTDRVQGVYDHLRGYFYSPDMTYHAADNHGYNNNDSLIIDIAQGPSVQVVANNWTSCINYYVGVLCAVGNAGVIPQPEFDVNNVYPIDSKLAFFQGHVFSGGNANNWMDSISARDNVDADYYSYDGSTANTWTSVGTKFMRIFPTLKYVDVQTPTPTYLRRSVMNAELPLRPGTNSYFALGFMKLLRVNTAAVTLYPYKPFTAVLCMTGVSFDNIHFTLKRFEPTGSGNALRDYSFLRQASQAPTVNNLASVPVYWGSQMGLSGEYGYGSLHPMWHNIKSNNYSFGTTYSGENVQTNAGGVIHLQAFRQDYAPNDPEGYLTQQAKPLRYMISPDVDRGTTADLDSTWPHYGWFNYRASGNNSGAWLGIPSIVSFDTIAPKIAHLADSRSGNYKHKEVIPVIGDQVVEIQNSRAPYGMGLLGFSDQRKAVMSGSCFHEVFESGDSVYYHFSANHDAIGGFVTDLANKSIPPVVIAWPQAGHLLSKPSIAVYENGDSHGCAGDAAIAVVWVDKQTTGGSTVVSIYMKTREFNMCTGLWPDWSDSILVHQHVSSVADNTTPVVAPIVSPSVDNPADGKVTMSKLIGWTVTWTMPDLRTFLPPKLATTGIYSRSLVRNASKSWGTYDAASSSTLVPSGMAYNVLATAADDLGSTASWPITIDFPSVVNEQNKSRLRADASSGANSFANNYCQAVTFSSSGDMPGVYTLNANYSRTGTPGSLVSKTPITNVAAPYVSLYSNVEKDRNPNITLNSSGQVFIAWERLMVKFIVSPEIYNPTAPSLLPPGGGSSMASLIAVVNTKPDGSWTTHTYKELFSESVNDLTWRWMRNPSIVGYPLCWRNNHNMVGAPDDSDRAVVELAAWRDNYGLNQITTKYFSEPGQVLGSGVWTGTPTVGPTPGLGTWSQRSFDPFGGGIRFPSGYIPPFYNGESFVLANDNIPGGSIPKGGSVNDLVRGREGTASYKVGLSDSISSLSYVGELITKDTSYVNFKWGNIHVVDSTAGTDELVQLHIGIDTNGYGGMTDVRDSIFVTEPFTWDNGTDFTYDKMLFSSDSLILSGPFATGVKLNYTVELLDGSTIDTAEVCTYDPSTGVAFYPTRTRVRNTSGFSKTVQLRVRMNHSGVAISDTTTEYQEDQTETPYYVLGDTVISLKIAGAKSRYEAKQGLLLQGPYAATAGTVQVSVGAPAQTDARLAVYDVLGRVISSSNFHVAGGVQDVTVETPSVSGTYYIVLSALGEQRTLPWNLVK